MGSFFSKTGPDKTIVKKYGTFKKWCCDERTHFPAKMYGCEDMMHDIASVIGRDSSLDAIISGGLETPPTVEQVKVYDEVIFDHAAIQCVVNGLVLFSWNLEGRCDEKYGADHVERRAAMKEFMARLNPFPDVLCFQELFLRSNMPPADKMRAEAEAILRDVVPNSNDFYYVFDGYTGGTIVHKKCAVTKESTAVESKSFEVTLTKGEAMPEIGEILKKIELDSKQIQRPMDNNKKCTVVHVKGKDKPFYVVNVHLKAVQMSLRGNSKHLKEVSNLLSHLKEEMKEGIVFIGDHNSVTPEKIYENATEGGKRRRTRKRPRRRCASRKRTKRYAVM
jgi:exonuclease III